MGEEQEWEKSREGRAAPWGKRVTFSQANEKTTRSSARLQGPENSKTSDQAFYQVSIVFGNLLLS